MTNNFTPAKAGQQRNRLSKEEYADKMKAEKEAVYQMADETAKAIVSDPEKFKAFLDTQSRLDRYSAVNALLIFKQLPEASQLKNFDDWSKDNVKIQKGAKSISILEPVEYAKRDGTTGISYNVKKVFDVSQTNGKRPPAPTVNRDPKALITVMLDSSPVEVEATNELPYPNMAAFYNNEEQTLYVKRDVGDSVAVAQCVAQELGHAQLSINSDSYSRADMGFQAVCIGYMLCKKYGVDTQNFAINRIPEKLAGKEPKDIRYELSKTRNAMADAKVLLPHFSCHSLRHTFTTRMCEAGVNVKVIQDTLGHKDISTTLNIYTDVTKELRRSEFEGLDSYFKNEYNKANEVL